MREQSMREVLEIGRTIYYTLPEEDTDTPEKAWKGRILDVIPVEPIQLSVVHVLSLEGGTFEGCREYIQARQIVLIGV